MQHNKANLRVVSAVLLLLVLGSDYAIAACPGNALTAPPNVTITLEVLAPAAAPYPEFCFVQGYVTTNVGNGNEDLFELVLPDPSAWNGKFLFEGNGGFAGSIQDDVRTGLVEATGEYATAATDAGHESVLNFAGLGDLDGSFGLNNPTAREDLLYNGVHVTAMAAQTLTAQYYGRPAVHRYFTGCSEGGHEAAVESQLYPRDFDGIIEGDPGIGSLIVGFNWNYTDSDLVSADSYIPASKINNLVDPAVTAECDALDGVTDGLIQDPRQCHFDPATIKCRASEPAGTADADPTCLSKGQVDALKAVYAGAKTAEGTQLYPGFTASNPADPGGWPTWISGETAPDLGVSEPWGPIPTEASGFTSPLTGLEAAPFQWTFMDQDFKYDFFLDATFDSAMFDLNNPSELLTVVSLSDFNHANGFHPERLEGFRDEGGKLLLYHGWSDQAVSPLATIDFYNRIGDDDDGRKREFARLFMAPGMHHCGGGPGPNFFDPLTPLDTWVTTGAAPDSILAAHFVNNDPTQPIDRTMPLCAYPEVAVYGGRGNVDAAANWSCRFLREDDDQLRSGRR